MKGVSRMKLVIRTLCVVLLASLIAKSDASASTFSERHFDLQTRNFSEFHCADEGEDCYQKAVEFLVPNENVSSPYSSDDLRSQGSKVTVMGHGRTPVAVLAIHGLYGSSAQFAREENLLKFLGINFVSLTLPGHGPFAQNYKDVKYEDWLKSARDAFRFAQALGDQVILMGQSTGGLLSYALALEDRKNVVAGLLLIEPAFRVRTDVQFLSCGLKRFVSKAQDAARLAKFVGHDVTGIQQPISTSMGCEVTRLAEYLLDTYAPVSANSALPDGEQQEPASYLDRYRALFSVRKLPPTLVGHTGHDDVVDDTVIQEFVQIQGRSILQDYDASKLNGKPVQHGDLTQQHLLGEGENRFWVFSPEKIKDQPIVQFLYEAYPSKIGYFKSSMENWVQAADYDRFLFQRKSFLFTMKLIDSILKLPTLDERVSALIVNIGRIGSIPFNFSEYSIKMCQAQNPSLAKECESFLVKGNYLELSCYLSSVWNVLNQTTKTMTFAEVAALPYQPASQMERDENEEHPKFKTERQAIEAILETFQRTFNDEGFKKSLLTIENTKFADRAESSFQ
jgi:pimeloyl-ACP methyl ester carboxylesterase